jgi:D-xylose transport system ATP-binding protein
LDKNTIIKMMVGREIKQMYPKRKIPGNEVVLKVENITVYNGDKKIINNASFDLKKSEILGITGLMGSGRTELVSSIFGSFRGKINGEVYYTNQKIGIKSPEEAIKKGFAFISEDRRNQGIIPTMSVGENITISKLIKYNKSILINKKATLIDIKGSIEKLNIKTPSIDTLVTKLSGGNQQKALIARSTLINPEILIIDEPTRGIDVNAKHEIYLLLNKLTNEGISIIMVSSELPEVIGLSDRIIVINKGEIAATFNNSEKDTPQEQIMKYAISIGEDQDE